MAEAPHTPEEMLETLARIVKGVDALYREGALHNNRVDDKFMTVALRRPPVYQFEWLFEGSQRQELQGLRSLHHDIEDWIAVVLAACKGDIPKEMYRRLSSRCRSALSELEGFLAFDPFRVPGEPDRDVVRKVLKGQLQELEGTAGELRDCIRRVGRLLRAESEPQQGGGTEVVERPETQVDAPASAPPSSELPGRAPGELPAGREVGPPFRSMADIMAEIKKIALTGHPLLFVGERGTGKSYLARRVHELSKRTGEFRHVSCPAVADPLFESEMFGHVEGAFSGAKEDKTGHIEAAADGTVFLDEIGDVQAGTQAKLLQVLQEGTYYRVGDEEQKTATCRFVLATNRDLAAMIRDGKFREDLYDRVSTFTFRVPPLRERREEIPALIKVFQERHQPKTGERRVTVPERRKLQEADFDWPGNVRMLENAVIRAFERAKKRAVAAEEILAAARENMP